MDSPPSRLSLFPFFSLSLCILLGRLENKEGGGVLFQIKTIAKKKKGLRKRQTTDQEEKPQNEISPSNNKATRHEKRNSRRKTAVTV
jgi:hypothetical protein